jgi:integrase/recombinase XerD
LDATAERTPESVPERVPARTPARKKAKELAKYLRGERPDYAYMKEVFRYLRAELEINVPRTAKKLPYVPTEAEIRRYYEVVWQSRNFQDVILIKLLLYTAARVSELVNMRLEDVDLGQCQIKVIAGKGGKDRLVLFPSSFREALALHMEAQRQKGAVYLFESSWKRRYSERGVRKILARYSQQAGMAQPISPHKLRHFLLTWLKKQGIDDALIQPYSGHASRQSLEIYSRLAMSEAQKEYDGVMARFPV